MNNPILYVAKIVHSTSSDGVGLRNSLYVSGCNIQCANCHNKHLWDIKAGKPMTVTEVFNLLNEDEFNISILGGEPLMQYKAILQLCRLIKLRTDKTIWLWSGHTIEEIQRCYPEILPFIDVLVDGPFMPEYFQPNLQWRGSTNQRVINIKEYTK